MSPAQVLNHVENSDPFRHPPPLFEQRQNNTSASHHHSLNQVTESRLMNLSREINQDNHLRQEKPPGSAVMSRSMSIMYSVSIQVWHRLYLNPPRHAPICHEIESLDASILPRRPRSQDQGSHSIFPPLHPIFVLQEPKRNKSHKESIIIQEIQVNIPIRNLYACCCDPFVATPQMKNLWLLV